MVDASNEKYIEYEDVGCLGRSFIDPGNFACLLSPRENRSVFAWLPLSCFQVDSSSHVHMLFVAIDCNAALSSCSGVILTGDTHENVDGRRDQARGPRAVRARWFWKSSKEDDDGRSPPGLRPPTVGYREVG